MLKAGLMIEKKMIDGKPAVKFTIQQVDKAAGLSEKLAELGFKFIKCENMAVKTVTSRDDALTALIAKYFNKDGSSK